MKTSRRTALVFALLALSVLAACGNKGDLVRPPPTPVTPASN